jgi:N-acetylglutamate synthase-like GNAT family acetyltransferase
MTTGGALEIVMLAPAEADNVQLTASLTGLINDVYAAAEDGLWTDGASRTTVEEITKLVGTGQVAVARIDGQIIGCVCIHLLGNRVGEFGMLAVVQDCRGGGVGRELVRFAEQAVRAERCDTMQLELLVPRGRSHPSKEFLARWYTRIGYKPARLDPIEESYPGLAPFLAIPCDLVIYHRTLVAQDQGPATSDRSR